MQEQIRALVGGFAANPTARAGFLREMLAADALAFRLGALPVLKSWEDPQGCEFLACLLAEKELLEDALCDPELFSSTEAIRLARLAVQAQPMLDVRLAKKLHTLDGPSGERVLLILEEIADGSRVVPMLAQMMRHANPRIRSKAALVIGQAIQKPEWVESLLRDADERTRANAIATLWGVNTPAAREVLRKAMGDPSGRVAANAMVGLYQLGDPRAVGGILKMSLQRHPASLARCAWAMEQTGDPRFARELARMQTYGAGRAAGRIEAAMERLRGAEAEYHQRGRVPVHILKAAASLGDLRKLRLAVAVPGARKFLDLPGTEFVVLEDERLIGDYQVRGFESDGMLAVGFSLCREGQWTLQDLEAAEEAVAVCLNRKRAADSWAVLKSPEEKVVFTADRSALQESLRKTSGPCSRRAAIEAWNRMVESAGRLRGSRHVILLAAGDSRPEASTPLGVPELELVASLARSKNVAIHVVAAGEFFRPQPLEAFCRKTGGILLAARGPAQVGSSLQEVYSSLLNRYEIHYTSGLVDGGAPASGVRVEVYTDFGCGQDSAMLEGAAEGRPSPGASSLRLRR